MEYRNHQKRLARLSPFGGGVTEKPDEEGNRNFNPMNSFVLPVLLDVVSGGILVYFFVGIAVIIVLLLILREIACWYWKINEWNVCVTG